MNVRFAALLSLLSLPAWAEEAAVVVTGQRPKAPVTEERLTAAELTARGAATLPEALALSPGVEVNGGPKSGATVEIRGFGERGVRLVLDGVPIGEVYDGHFDLSSLMVAQVGQVVVERGVTSVLHGPGTMGGVVSLESFEDLGERVAEGEVWFGPLEGVGFGGHARTSLAFDDFTFNTALAFSLSDGYPLSADYRVNEDTAPFEEDGGTRDGSDFIRFAGSTRLIYRPSARLRAEVSAHRFSQERGVPTMQAASYTRHWRFSEYDTDLYLGKVSWLGEGALAELTALAFASLHRDTLEDYESAEYEALTQDPLAWFVKSSYENQTLGGSLSSTWQLEDHTLTVLARAQNDTNEQREIPVKRDYVNDVWNPWETYGASLFTVAAEDCWQLGDFRLIAGAGGTGQQLTEQRLRSQSREVADGTAWGVDGRLFADYQLSWGRLVAAVGRKTRHPTLKELYSNVVGGNPDLKPEIAWVSELGADAQDVGVKGLTLSGRVYYNRIEDLIDKPGSTYENVEGAITAGAEVTLGYRLGGLGISAAYSYLYTRDDQTERPLDYRTPHRAGLQGRYAFPFGLSLGAQVELRSGQEAAYYDPFSTLADEDGWVREALPGFALLSAQVSQRVLFSEDDPVYLFGRGQNLTDTDWVAGGYAPRPGRQLFVGLGTEL